MPAGGLSLDRTRWIRARDNYFLPKKVLGELFRGKFVDALKEAFQHGQLQRRTLVNPPYAGKFRTQSALLVRGSSRRIHNYAVPTGEYQSDQLSRQPLDCDLRRLPRAGQKRNQDSKYQLTGRFILGVQPTL